MEGKGILQSKAERERRQEYFGSRGNAFKATSGNSMSLTNNREQDSSRPKRSVLGDVRSITRKKDAEGRDIVEIEHTDGTGTILAFEKVS